MQSQLTDERLLDVHGVVRMIGDPRVTEASVYRAHRLGLMPKGVRAFGRLRWRESQIADYLCGAWVPSEGRAA